MRRIRSAPPGAGVSDRVGVAAWVVAFAAFVAGFGVAELTGVRALGGAVLAAGGAYCFAAVRRDAGAVRAAAVLVLALALFVVAHPLGDAIGSWPAAILAGAVTAAAVRASAA